MTSFEDLYRTHYGKVYGFLYKLCRDENLAEELTQETFFQAYGALPRYRGECGIFTWLVSIAKHTYYKYLRKKKAGLEATDLDAIADRVAAWEDTPEEQVERESVKEAVKAVLKKLPDKYSDVVMLRVYAQLPFREIAESLKISENSAKVLYFRAKKMLMEELSHEFAL
ncbi:MAG: sigma-70 family RNA polymerase sigma factor [Clostridiaceae bacterium]|nr:sigma-70 family RNA polymerase sigma factor [Clostridiaceae bacterium]